MTISRSLPADAARLRVKICGLSTPETVAAAVRAGAAYVGYVLYPPSPRAVGLDDLPALTAAVPPGVVKVALAVEPDDALIDRIAAAPIDMIQLHGHEPPDRVASVKARSGLPVMKALGVREAADLAAIDIHARVADQLLIDAKPPRGAGLPGGNGVNFDWRLIAGRRWPVPWMLAGGLTADNLAEAVRLTGARQVDVSTGVEIAAGRKDPARIAAFLAAA